MSRRKKKLATEAQAPMWSMCGESNLLAIFCLQSEIVECQRQSQCVDNGNTLHKPWSVLSSIGIIIQMIK